MKNNKPLTDLMWHTLEQVCAGVKFVDIRSASALHRRGLVVWTSAYDSRGHYYPLYTATEKGMAMNTERQMAKVVRGNKVLRKIVALFAEKQA